MFLRKSSPSAICLAHRKEKMGEVGRAGFNQTGVRNLKAIDSEWIVGLKHPPKIQ
jgi:hypothetical protein